MSPNAARHPSAGAVKRPGRPPGRPASRPQGRPSGRRPASRPQGPPPGRPASTPSSRPPGTPKAGTAASKAETAPSKPHLRIAPQQQRKFRKLFIAGITLGLLGLVAIPFGIVFLHANLLTGQRDLDQMRQDLNAQLEQRQQLLFDRSLAVSPQRIITIARDQLGMVPAENIVYLQSVSLPDTAAPADAASPAKPSVSEATP